MQILTAFLLVIGIAVLGIWGIVNSNASISSALFDFTPSNFTERFITSIGISVFLYVGFEWVAPVAYNSAAFTYKIPRAMQIAILINIVMFSLFCLGTMLHVPVETIVENGVPQVSLAGQLLGNTGLIIALVLSVFAIISTFNAGLMGGARLLYGIAREGILPGSLTRTTASGTPATSIIALSILVLGCSILAIEFELSLLFAIIGSVIICFVYACSLASLLRIRKKQPGRKFRYESRIPVSIQYFLIALLFIFGVMSIFSIPKLSYSVLIYIGAFALTSYVSTHLLLKRKAQSELNNLQR
jgi:ethanolamine permease